MDELRRRHCLARANCPVVRARSSRSSIVVGCRVGTISSVIGVSRAASRQVEFAAYVACRVQLRRRVNASIGKRRWAIAEGYIPPYGHGQAPEFTSHETACLLNASDEEAHVVITVYFSDRDPVGPYRITVPARRTKHLRFNDLEAPEPIPRGTDYSSVIESDVPIVVQHTRLDSRQADTALLSTIAFSSD
jgi:hypothetical protein